MKSLFKKALIAALAIGFFSIAGEMDYQDELLQEQHYCEMVNSGDWGAYNGDIDCNGNS